MANLKNVKIADPLAWLDSLAQPESLVALAAFAACVLLAWCLVWVVRRAFREADLSVLLGQRLIDGASRSLAEDFFRRFEEALAKRYPAAPSDAAR